METENKEVIFEADSNNKKIVAAHKLYRLYFDHGIYVPI